MSLNYINFDNCFLNNTHKQYIKNKILSNDYCNFIFSGEYNELFINLFIQEYIKCKNINKSSILRYNTIYNSHYSEYYNINDNDNLEDIKNKIIDFNNIQINKKGLIIIENINNGATNFQNLLIQIKNKCSNCHIILSCYNISNIKQNIVNEFIVIESPRILYEDYDNLLKQYLNSTVYITLDKTFKKELYILSNANIITGMKYIDILSNYDSNKNINTLLNIVFNTPNINLIIDFVNNYIINGTINDLQQNISIYYYKHGIKINDFINYLWEIFWDNTEIKEEQRTEVLRLLSKFKFYSLKNFDNYNLLIRYLIKIKKVFI